jgi:hypothetical protein
MRSGQSYELRVAPERVDTNETAECFASSRAVGSGHDALSGKLLDHGQPARGIGCVWTWGRPAIRSSERKETRSRRPG